MSADFTVPHLNPAKSPDNSWASHWVGLDGATNSTVEQVGIDTYVSGGVDYYDEGDLMWLEVETFDPDALRMIREATRTTICTGRS